MASFLLGRNANALYNNEKTKVVSPGGKAEWDAWRILAATVVADNLTDVSLNMAADFADTTTRGVAQSGFSSSVPVLKNGEITFEMRWLPEDPAVIAAPFSFTRVLIDAWETDDTVSLMFLDQAGKETQLPLGVTERTQGLVANWSVSLDKSEDLRDIQRASVTLTIADSPLWYQENITGT